MKQKPFNIIKMLVCIFLTLMCAFLIIIQRNTFPLPNMGCDYMLERNGVDDISLAHLKTKNGPLIYLIFGHVLGYAFDSNFILIVERPRDSVSCVYCQKYDDYQRAFYESEFRQYWIINKKECCRYSLDTINIKTKYSNVYGPFKEEEFWKKRNELGVSDTLQIREYYKPTKPKDWRTYFIPKMRKGEQRQ